MECRIFKMPPTFSSLSPKNIADSARILWILPFQCPNQKINSMFDMWFTFKAHIRVIKGLSPRGGSFLCDPNGVPQRRRHISQYKKNTSKRLYAVVLWGKFRFMASITFDQLSKCCEFNGYGITIMRSEDATLGHGLRDTCTTPQTKG